MERLTLTPHEVSQVLNVGRNGVYTLLQRGELRGIRIGRKKWLIPRQEVERWLTAQVDKSEAPLS